MSDSRLQAVLAGLTASRVQALLVTTPANTYYLTGFRAAAYSRPVVVIAGEKPALIVPELEEEHAAEASHIRNLRTYSDTRLGSEPGSSPLALALQTALDMLGELGIHGAVGFECEGLSFAGYRQLRARLGDRVVPLSGAVERLRMVKDAAG